MSIKTFLGKKKRAFERRYRFKAAKNNPNAKRAFVIGTPEHGNLGDHAIAIAQEKFLNDYFPDYIVVDISAHHFRNDKKYIKSFVREGDMIFITGGGSLGSLWIEDEMLVREVLSMFPRHQVVVFPQTLYFESEKCFNDSVIAYNKNNNMKLCVREKNSYKVATRMLPENRILIMPDIVTYLQYSESVNRDGLLFCMRQDKEKTLSNDIVKQLEDKFKGKKIRYTDTVLQDVFFYDKRFDMVMEKLNEFKSSELVVTDRLHGMLFAVITGTPCIAFDNLSKKVSGVYEMIKSLDYITFVNDFDTFDFDQFINDVKNTNSCYCNSCFKKYYDDLYNFIVGEN